MISILTMPVMFSLIASPSCNKSPAAKNPVYGDRPICLGPPIKDPKYYTIPTSHGEVAVWDTLGSGKPVLFLHGNSCCKEVFSPQLNSNLAKQYRFIAIDLPGHGQSERALDPEKTYSFDGYADVVMEVIQKMKLQNPAVVGWSLGGHIALSALDKGQPFAGVLITGTPPIELTPAGFQKGFHPIPGIMELWSKPHLTKEEAIRFIRGTNTAFDLEKDPFILDAVLKTDGQCRVFLSQSIWKNSIVNQKTIVETNATPLCIIQGRNDKINLSYLTQEINYKNLFNEQVYIIEEAGHAAFWEKPEAFNAILDEFLTSTLKD
ncbi:MAG: alpha/beta hydrolase [Verrucomicrobia bacterium]|nr:alpha/beta hydrolase [Verrucomicrobiota bacterium]